MVHSDANNHVKVLLSQSPKATIGKSTNKFDVTKMGCLNKVVWRKGLIYH